MSQNIIDRAYAVVAGNNGATALYFSRPSSTDESSIKLGQKGSTHFTSKEVAEVNHMHNICAGEPNYYVHKDNVAAQVRQSGAIIVLGNGSNQSVSFANGAGDGKWLKAGTYTDKVGGGTFTVTNSTISGQVGSTGIAVIYNGATEPTGKYVYFDNAGKWSNVYCYFYDGTTSASVWPGEQMTFDATATHNGKTGWYKVSIPAGFTYGKYVLNDGTGAQQITGSSLYTTQGTTLNNASATSN